MRRCMPLYLALAVLGACRGQESTKPEAPAAPPAPLTMKFDGNDHGGNPDFFLLPPLAKDPKGTPNYDVGASNVSLTPTVDVCLLDVAGTTQAQMQANVSASTPCKGALVFSATLGAANVSRGILDDNDIDLLHFIATHYPSLTEPYYHVGWKVPATARLGSSTLPAFYRVAVRVGDKPLGFVDVESVNNFAQLFNVNTGDFVPLTGGLWLPINFRIERYALCTTPGVGPCASQAVDLSTGGTVSTVLDPVNNPLPSGITIQPSSGGTTTTFTVESCPDLNPRAIDLPTFGHCVRVTATPALPNGAFAAAATVFDCNITDQSIPHDGDGALVNSHDQADRITLHKLDVVDGKQVVVALPHAPACGFKPVSDAGGSLRGMLAQLRHGRFGAAVRELGGILSPRPAYAATMMMIDLGGGGLTVDCCSDFQFALPARLEIDQSTNNQLAAQGELLPLAPTVIARDLGGEPVRNVTVHFKTSTGDVNAADVKTATDGRAQTGWTLGSAAANVLSASGRGVGGADLNGPRRTPGSEIDDIIDPFQPIQAKFDPGFAGVPTFVELGTGTVTLRATTLLQPVGGFDFGSPFRFTNIALGGSPPTGFQSATFDASTWLVANAPFGSGGCGAAPATAWPINSGLLLRKTFSTRAAGSLTIQVHIDNDIRLWVDGNEVTSSGTPGQASFYNSDTGWWIHDNCVLSSPPTFTANVQAGNHVLAVWATDRGGDSHFDVSISPTVVIP